MAKRKTFGQRSYRVITRWQSLPIQRTSYTKVIGEINDPPGPDDAIRHMGRKSLSNWIQTFRMIRKRAFENRGIGIADKIALMAKLSPEAA